MIKYLLLISIIVFTSCRPTFISQDVQGQFYKEGKDFQYSLDLRRDSSFYFTKKYFDGNSTCRGKWQRLANDTLILKCDDPDLSAQLQSGYMTERERVVILLSKNRLKVDNVILIRKQD
jgi:hypothetical protein